MQLVIQVLFRLRDKAHCQLQALFLQGRAGYLTVLTLYLHDMIVIGLINQQWRYCTYPVYAMVLAFGPQSAKPRQNLSAQQDWICTSSLWTCQVRNGWGSYLGVMLGLQKLQIVPRSSYMSLYELYSSIPY